MNIDDRFAIAGDAAPAGPDESRLSRDEDHGCRLLLASAGATVALSGELRFDTPLGW